LLDTYQLTNFQFVFTYGPLCSHLYSAINNSLHALIIISVQQIFSFTAVSVQCCQTRNTIPHEP